MKRIKKLLILVFLGLLLFSLARLFLFIKYSATFSDYTFFQIVLAFILGVRFDASIFLTLTSPFWLVLLFLPTRFKLAHKISLWLMYCVYMFMASFLLADVFYFGYISRHIANEPFVMGNDLSFLFGMAHVFIFTILIAIIAFIIGAIFWRKLVNIDLVEDKSTKRTIIYGIISVGLIFLLIRGTISDKPISTIDAFSQGDVNLGNLTLNGLFSTARYIGKAGVEGNNYSFFDNASSIFTKQSVSKKPQIVNEINKPNIVLILLEGWSAYYVDSFSDNKFNLTPNLDRLANSGYKFTRHYAPDMRSISAIQAVLTAIPIISNMPSLGSGLETLAVGNIGGVLRANGYDTIFLQSSRRRSFYMDAIAKSLGFSGYYGAEDQKIALDYKDKKASKFGWDYETYMLLFEKLNNANKPFFSFLFTGTTHTPFAILPNEFMRYPHDIESEGGFMNTLLYADWSLGEFFKWAEGESWYDNTIFIITADHNIGKYEKVIFPENYRVPLIIYSPKINEPKVFDNVTNHLDITATILDVASINNDSGNILSQSVFNKDNESFAIINLWNFTGLVEKNSFINYNFKDILNYYPEDMSDVEKLKLINKIKAFHQIAIERISGGS